MRLALATIAASLMWTACSTAGPALPANIEPGKSFSLKPGEVAQAQDLALRVGFEGVPVDSRCPRGEQCVWAGDAIARVWLQQGAGPRQVRELHTAQGSMQTVRILDHELRLLRLDPYPITGKVVQPGDYVAALMLSLASSADPER